MAQLLTLTYRRSIYEYTLRYVYKTDSEDNKENILPIVNENGALNHDFHSNSTTYTTPTRYTSTSLQRSTSSDSTDSLPGLLNRETI
jgi:hypothetical protein